MNGTGIVDNFLGIFSSYIDSGFGLLGGEVAFLSTTLIVIDVTIAGLFWAWGADEDVLQRLIKKTLHIGTFAFIIGNFATLATILFDSFAGLGLKAGGGTLTLDAFMRPSSVAGAGIDAAKPLLEAAGQFSSLWAFFANATLIAVLLIGWVLVILAFFCMAAQIFLTLIEFKLVTLIGFVLLPFAFYNRTAFMAERVLGHIVSSGIKVLTLGVITSIGTTLFSQFLTLAPGTEPTAEQVLALILAALVFGGLSIFGPSIANGIVSGGPQLGAGASAGTALAAGATLAGGAAVVGLAGGAAAGALSAAASGGARAAGSASAAYSAGAAGRSGASAVAGGVSSVGKAAMQGAMSPLRRAVDAAKQNFAAGRAGSPSPAGGPENGGQPAWAKSMKRRQAITHGAGIASQTLKSGDSHGGGASPDISEKD